MEIKDTEINENDYSLKHGFAWLIFTDGKKEYTLQACLKELDKCKDEKKRWKMVNNNENLFKKAIDIDDDGMDWGLCGDANHDAFVKYGIDSCRKFFKKEIRLTGIRFE